MSIQIRDAGGVLRTVTAIYLRTVDGTDPANLKAIKSVDLRVADGILAGDLKNVYEQGIRLAVSPDYAAGSSPQKTGPIYTNSVTVGVAGGAPPYTHSWSVTGGISANASTSATTAFVGVPPAISGTLDGDGTDTVTDANGLTNSISIPVNIERG